MLSLNPCLLPPERKERFHRSSSSTSSPPWPSPLLLFFFLFSLPFSLDTHLYPSHCWRSEREQASHKLEPWCYMTFGFLGRKCACFKHLFLCGPQGFWGIQVEVREMEGGGGASGQWGASGWGIGSDGKKKKVQECLLVFLQIHTTTWNAGNFHLASKQWFSQTLPCINIKERTSNKYIKSSCNIHNPTTKLLFAASCVMVGEIQTQPHCIMFSTFCEEYAEYRFDLQTV